MIRFGFDGDTAVFTAHAAGENWNGWLCPIVDKATLSAVIARWIERDDEGAVELAFGRGGTAVVWEYEFDGESRKLVNEREINPTAEGRYLLDLGLTLAAL